MKKLSDISFVCPAYNDAENLSPLIKVMDQELCKFFEKYEIIIVEDCSPDNTGAVADKLAQQYRHIKVIHNRTRLNFGGAMKTGFQEARYNLIGYVDGDNQFDFKEMSRFLPLLEKADAVSGWRIFRAESWWRKLQSLTFNLLLRIIFGLRVKDANAGFKIYKRRVIEAIQPIESVSGFIDAEMLIKAQADGWRIVSIPVSHRVRRYGPASGGHYRVIVETVMEMTHRRFTHYVKKNALAKVVYFLVCHVSHVASLLPTRVLKQHPIIA